ncbi:polysaccharide biosynthesis/export family protein [Prosthecobacter sp.]|uniref:polysaccharide biosynthesis/export family protein n=1 Tax=Prosthecobacter sp. TaxID=1965333 RepID=UPI0037840A70
MNIHKHLTFIPGRGCLRGVFVALCCAGLNSTLQAQQPAAFPAGSSSPQASQKGTMPADYQIREGDMVQVSVFDEPELAAGGRVRKDGTIQCPLIGSIKIQGLSQTAAARAIEEAYRKDYLVHPEVNLFVSQFSVQRITILGQVQRPGAHELPAEKDLTILQVLGLAGGPTRIANLKKVLVKRIVEGREKIFRVDVNSMASGNQTMMFYVREDDVITVPESFF